MQHDEYHTHGTCKDTTIGAPHVTKSTFAGRVQTSTDDLLLSNHDGSAICLHHYAVSTYEQQAHWMCCKQYRELLVI